MPTLKIAYGGFFTEQGFNEVFFPSLAEQEVFVEKAGKEILNQMYVFQDRGERAVCLIPEVTALVQKQWREEWSKTQKQPMKIMYVQRCYRYERPQAGRYREFTQLGVEILGGNREAAKETAVQTLRGALDLFGVPYAFSPSVVRGLSYYVESGFEAEVEYLGAQKQIAGGGAYAEGVGWAIGLDRLVLAIMKRG